MDNIEQVKQAEAALVGAVLRGGAAAFEQVRDLLTADDFGIHAYSYAWQAMSELQSDGLPIDVLTVGDQLERAGRMSEFVSGPWSGRALLSDLRANGDPRNVIGYAENVGDYAAKRRLKDIAVKMAGMSANGKRAKDIMDEVYAEMGKLVLPNASDEYTVSIKQAVSEAYDETDAASQGKAIGVLTGLVDLDKLLGSMKRQCVYTVAGRPGQGKTGLLLTVALNAARAGKRVCIFSLEMPRAQVAQRLIAMHETLDMFRVMEGKLTDGEWPRYTNGVEHVAALPIIINDLSSINIGAIRSTARKLHKIAPLDMVIVDYVQLADAGKKTQTRELEVSEVMRGLKYLARELNLPVLAAAQLSRAVEQRAGGKPVLADLRESGSIENDSYGVWFIHRPDELQPNAVELLIAKHRNGKTGSVPLYFRAECTRFDNATSRIERIEN